jgi:hypothetical protein
MHGLLRHFRTIGTKSFNSLLNACHILTPRDFKEELHRRQAGRQSGSQQWLTSEEAAVAQALVKIVVPSDEESPGIDEVCVLGPSAITSLDKMIKECPERQHSYSRGLLSFDFWALKEHGCKFSELSIDQQTKLFRAAQVLSDHWNANGSLIGKLRRRLGALAEIRRGTFYAAPLYRMIRDDSLQIFYTSRVSWVWLGYDGPPMEKGYLDLSSPRGSVTNAQNAINGRVAAKPTKANTEH